jgi:Family of unknown function (DUF6270)
VTSMATGVPSRKVFIYGSCVSRDTFEYLRPLGYELLDYVARQSLISAYSPAATDLLTPFKADSAFQRRMLHDDWRASLVPAVHARCAQTDLLLWDLCDERLGVRDLGQQVFVTRSVDLLTTGVDGRIQDRSTLVDFGSDRHAQLWRASLAKWRGTLEQSGLLGRLVLVAPPWAELTLGGASSPTSFGRTARQANSIFERYHEAAARMLGCPVVSLDRSAARSDPDHRWGLAPFHYSHQNYVSLAEQIDAAASTLCSARSRTE